MIDLFRCFIAPEAASAVAKVLTADENGRIYVGQGSQCTEFEKEFAALAGVPRQPLMVNSCTSAITLALDLCGVKAGDFVISTPVTCTATNTPIVNLGANIVWADVNPYTGLIDPNSVEKILKKGNFNSHGSQRYPRAIIAVDWGGSVCDYAALKSFGIPVIEDAAHRVNLAPEHGDYVCWSTQAIKFLTTGDGGLLLTPEDKHEEAKLLRWYGLDRESSADFRCQQNIKRCGWKFQSNDIAAAIGRANIPYVRKHIAEARNNSMVLKTRIQNPKVLHPCINETIDPWLYTLLVDDRSSFIPYMKEKGIAVSPVHQRNDGHDCFSAFRRNLPGVDYFASRHAAVPNGFWVTAEELDYIIKAVNAWGK